MKVIVGLGNPGPEYQRSRHNVGFMVLDELAQGKSWSKSKSGLLEECWLKSGTEELLLIKPQTFMNKSGEAVKYVMKKHPGLISQDLWVIHDDLDLELGNYKIQLGVGPKQHHGLLSIYDQLDSADFWHVRIGVDGRQGLRQTSPDRYVLMNFSPAESEILTSIIQQAVEQIHARFN